MSKKIGALAIAILAASSQVTLAQTTTTGTMPVSMTVAALCSVSAAPLSFPSASFLDASTDASSTLTVRCTNGTFYYVTMGLGANATNNPDGRRMKANADDFLNYELFTDSARTTPWLASATTAPTDSTPVAGIPSAAGNGSNQTINVFGRVPVQNAAPGSYTDAVTVTLTY